MPIREQLGDFSSIVCFKALVVGVEDTLGAAAAGVALKGAGRKRGKNLAQSLGFGKTALTVKQAAKAMSAALGSDGTRLCSVDKIEQDGDNYKIYLSDTVCSAGEPQGSPRELSFTLGAVHGAMEVLVGKRMRCKQVGSVLRGQEHDILELTPV
jgi:hypothetical protein